MTVSPKPERISVLTALSQPRGVAVIGASNDITKLGGRPVANLISCGYSGAIVPVNARRSEIRGLHAYPSITDYDGPVDLAGLIVPAADVPAELRRCAEAGVSVAVLFSSGFAETGTPQGRALQEEIQHICATTGIRVIGPNCIGTASPEHGAVMSFASTLSGEQSGGPTAMVSQSGAVALWMYTSAQHAGLRFSHFVNTGNEADLTVAAVMRELVEHDGVRTLLGYFEALHDFGLLADTARRARELDKPVVVLKAGRSDVGARAAVSHSGSLAGSERVADAALRQLGVLRVHDTDELIDAARVFGDGRRTRGRGVTMLSASGGGGIMLADAAADHGLEPAVWDGAWCDRLASVLPSYGIPGNPVDLTATSGVDMSILEGALQLAVEHPGTDMIALFGGDQAFTREWLEAIHHAYLSTDKPFVVCWLGDGVAQRTLTDWGVPVLPSPGRAMKALGLLARHSLAGPPAQPPRGDDGARGLALDVIAGARAAGRDQLDELEGSRLLAAYGVTVPHAVAASAPEAAVQAASAIGGTVAVKVLSSKIAHKSDAGGVRLGLASADEVRTAAADLLALAAAHGEEKPQVLVAEMLPPGPEMILGLVHDAATGPMVLVGCGGVLVELLDDTAMGRAPFGEDEAARLLSSLRSARLLDGLRGSPPADRAAVVTLLTRLSRLAHDLEDEILELDVNPVIVGPRGSGAVAADALVRLRPAAKEAR